MAMSIDEAIKGLHDIQKCYNDDSDAMFLGFDDKDNKSVDFAIDTMRKYQKIEEEYKKYLNNMVTNIYADGKFIKALIEVLEDGKTD